MVARRERADKEAEAYEIDTNRGNVGLGVRVIGKTQQQARLSHTGITDEEKLEEVVVSVGESAMISFIVAFSLLPAAT